MISRLAYRSGCDYPLSDVVEQDASNLNADIALARARGPESSQEVFRPGKMSSPFNERDLLGKAREEGAGLRLIENMTLDEGVFDLGDGEGARRIQDKRDFACISTRLSYNSSGVPQRGPEDEASVGSLDAREWLARKQGGQIQAESTSIPHVVGRRDFREALPFNERWTGEEVHERQAVDSDAFALERSQEGQHGVDQDASDLEEDGGTMLSGGIFGDGDGAHGHHTVIEHDAAEYATTSRDASILGQGAKEDFALM